jgi:hypothetical protein
MEPGELIAAIEEPLDDGTADPGCAVMLDIAGRWTGIKGVTVEDGIVYIESAADGFPPPPGKMLGEPPR